MGLRELQLLLLAAFVFVIVVFAWLALKKKNATAQSAPCPWCQTKVPTTASVCAQCTREMPPNWP